MRTLTANISGIAAGKNYACAIAGGGIRCWGGDPNTGINVIGDGSAPNDNGQINPIPTAAIELNANVVSVSSNFHHTCAIRRVADTDSLWCWGSNAAGQLGDGDTMQGNVPVQVQGLPTPITAVATGFDFTCAIAGGGAWCWGNNGVGQLGIGSNNENHFVPEPVSGLVAGVTAIAAANGRACAVVNSSVMCWGKNSPFGVLGDGTTTDHNLPASVTGLPSGAAAVAMGAGHTCALANGGIRCWGDNGSGQLGDGTQTTPLHGAKVEVVGLSEGSGVREIAAPAAGNYTCAILQNHTASCWGLNDAGELGNGNQNTQSSPTAVIEADFIFYDGFGSFDG